MQPSEFDFKIFKTAGEEFFNSLIGQLTALGVPTETMPCDHLCFRVGNEEEYRLFKTALIECGELLTEAVVNGRAISTFRLTIPFVSRDRSVHLLELPAPKSGAPYATGFEHAEFVLREDFAVFRAKHPDLQLTDRGPQSLNAELCLKLPNGAQAKFHHLSLDRVIQIEEAQITDVVFDFDGTLIDSRASIHETNRVVFAKALGREVSLAEAIEKYHPEFTKLFDAYGIQCAIKQSQALADWGEVASQFSCELFSGVHEALQSLQKAGFTLHLWTARDEVSARKILAAHGLEGFFKTFSFATADNSKPHAASLLFDWRAADQNSVLVIGDSPADIIGAKNINAIAGAALWDLSADRNRLKHAGAELFFQDIGEAATWIMQTRKELS